MHYGITALRHYGLRRGLPMGTSAGRALPVFGPPLLRVLQSMYTTPGGSRTEAAEISHRLG